ncbi:MAG: hypothetical protein ACRD8W_04805 [Nitrososphaeraceae archaeon]
MEREVNQGWKQTDVWYLNRHDNTQADPDIQILTEDNLEDENKELREYWCAIRKSKLDYIKNMDMWYCSACVQYYDTKIQDVPIKDLSESKVRTYTELDHYPPYEENDIYLPFVEGVNQDADEDIPSNVEVVSDDGHRKHIRVKGLPMEVLSTMRELDGRGE